MFINLPIVMNTLVSREWPLGQNLPTMKFTSYRDPITNEIWVSCRSIVLSIGYGENLIRSRVSPLNRKIWNVLCPQPGHVVLPHNWNPNTTMVNQLGLRQLVGKSLWFRVEKLWRATFPDTSPLEPNTEDMSSVYFGKVIRVGNGNISVSVCVDPLNGEIWTRVSDLKAHFDHFDPNPDLTSRVREIFCDNLIEICPNELDDIVLNDSGVLHFMSCVIKINSNQLSSLLVTEIESLRAEFDRNEREYSAKQATLRGEIERREQILRETQDGLQVSSPYTTERPDGPKRPQREYIWLYEYVNFANQNIVRVNCGMRCHMVQCLDELKKKRLPNVKWRTIECHSGTAKMTWYNFKFYDRNTMLMMEKFSELKKRGPYSYEEYYAIRPEEVAVKLSGTIRQEKYRVTLDHLLKHHILYGERFMDTLGERIEYFSRRATAGLRHKMVPTLTK
ncbi:CUN095 putative bro protein, similar to AcMNPV ORF2 [Culex nigripalpus nucleopolyhedrovirus]|uniref:CUN095 putative bro protein, similar to AcMNPV ORF2 n=1 Tax=Culex nigripalpus nucleopolyhedrovirus (isolate Florida/1997) TaxID=645993 RepID=Q919I2_NPVCO|nr:CUN095 putative bro protein, similar to AcMNPV ORF2 [Culex nigripalpus nucleopolyhedrovirus]AAK94173.1 CUN095 putative bro protein, similar to AcMNPV ORF2 [Culex nigripalpus nucleopolyhedrovirus]